MKDKILALLKTKFTGVREDGLNLLAGVLALQVDTEEKANEVVGNLTADQVNSYVTEWRKGADAEITKANKTFEDNLKKTFDFVKKETNPAPNPVPSKNDDIAAIVAEAIKTAVAPLQEKISAFESGKTSELRLNTLKSKLETCNDEVFKSKTLKDFARMNFASDDDFNAYITDTETDIKTANQNIANQGLGFFEKPIVPKNPTGNEPSKEELDAIMEKIPI